MVSGRAVVATSPRAYAVTLPPPFGSLIDADSLTAEETGLNSIPRENWPPVVIPFFAFRIMVGCGLVMLGLAWFGTYLSYKHRLAPCKECSGKGHRLRRFSRMAKKLNL